MLIHLDLDNYFILQDTGLFIFLLNIFVYIFLNLNLIIDLLRLKVFIYVEYVPLHILTFTMYALYRCLFINLGK